jgi:hypothetical protein
MSLISCEDPASSEGDLTWLAQSHTVPIHPFNQARWFIIVDFIVASVLAVLRATSEYLFALAQA